MKLSTLAVAALVPLIGVGYSASMDWPYVGAYVSLDSSDLGAIASGAAGVSASICVATDNRGCPGAEAVVASAASYTAVYGFCPGDLDACLMWPYAVRCE